MPIVPKCVTILTGYESRGNALIYQLADHACAATAAAQAAPVAQRFLLLRRAMELRMRELEAWASLGDKVGQSLACMGIANVYFLTDRLDVMRLGNSLEQARTWYLRAEAHLEGLDDEGAVTQRNTVRANALQLDLFAATRLLHKTVRVRGLVNAAHLNGRVGRAEAVHSACRYAVSLVPGGGDPEVTVAIHERNLVVVREGE